MRSSLMSGTFIAILTAISALFVSPMAVDKMVVTGGKPERPFIVAVVGNGVLTKGAPETRPEDNSNDAKGFDLWIGANASADKLSKAGTPPDFDLVGYDDDDDETKAGTIAAEIRRNPRILAVIGHGITATTRVGGTQYSDLGIPLIVPFATAEKAVMRASPTNQDQSRAEHLRNVYRLPPSDARAQAPAIAYLVKKLTLKNTDLKNTDLKNTDLKNTDLKNTDVHLEVSVYGNAEQYSQPLCSDVDRLLRDHNLNPHMRTIVGAVQDEALHIGTEQSKDKHSGVVVYCGYQQQAVDFLKAMDTLYSKHSEVTPPILIFNDGVFDIEKTPNLKTKFQIYRTTGRLAPETCDDKEALNALTAAYKDHPPTVPQTFGFDAVQVLAIAAHRCDGHLSRSCLLNELNSGRTFPGFCTDYSFHGGENIVADYYIFGPLMTSDVASTDLQPSFVTLTPQQLLHVLASTQSKGADER